jgi:hypothetical protein
MQWLASALQFGIQPARADRDIGAGLNGGEQLVRFLDRRREIGITKKCNISLGVKHSIADAETLAAITRVFYKPETGILLGVPAYDLDGVIPRSVINDQNFYFPGSLVAVGKNTVEGVTNALALIVGGDNDAVLRWLCVCRQLAIFQLLELGSVRRVSRKPRRKSKAKG